MVVQKTIKQLISLISYVTYTDFCLTFLSLWASFPHADILPKMHIQGSIPDFRVGQVKGHVSLKMFRKYSTNGKDPRGITKAT